MMKFKKLLSIALLVTMILNLAFTGCAKKDEPATPGETPAKAEVVEVDIFQFKVEINAELQAAIEAYQDMNPNVKINLETVGGGDDYGAALLAKFQSGSEPDIYNVGGPQDVADWMGKLEDLSDQPWVKDAVEGVLSGVTMDSKVYGLPYAIEGYGFAYNKAIFEDAGIDASKIKDYASLETAVVELDKKIKSGELSDKYPLLEAVFEFPAKETWVTGLHLANVALSQEFSSSIEANEAKSVEFKYADAFKKLVDIQADYSSSAKKKGNLNAVDYATQVDNGLAIERVAIIQQGNWIYGGIEGIDETVASNLAFLPIPIEGGKGDSVPVGVPMYWTVNSASPDAEKTAAKDFLNWLYTSEEGKKIVVEKFFFIPPLTTYVGIDPKDPLGKSIKEYADQGKTMPWVFMGYPTGWGMEVLGAELQKYLAGDITWEEAINNSKDQWVELRK
ncbi:MAG: sugar ABC transporter substrate-binding protein [Firmicutes bacterium HGW-Firmicutes-1]|nr:MAG: sugar ABC transporter substrate-binding protein [Firmicutes bacterium HGW-Firmicutes-1]